MKSTSRRRKFEKIIEYFTINMPDAKTELNYRNPYELLVAVVLSAQCTDKRVNLITPSFFDKYPTVQTLAYASLESIFELIKSCSFPNNKAKHLLEAAQMIVRDFKGTLPDNRELLQKIPGVGRKTANVLLSVAFNKPAMAVDTHVFRVSARIGLSENSKSPEETEKQLTEYFPEHLLPVAHHWLILHGRYVCTARNPKCDSCGISEFCNYFSEKKKEL